MKNADTWKPSKYDYINGKMIASHDPDELGAGSFLIASITADLYNEFIPKYAKGRLLDLGCGKIPMYGLYNAYTTENTCVDWINSLHSNPHIDLEFDISKTLPFEDGSFDTIICSDVLEHIYNPQSVLGEMVRICSKGGHIMVNTPFTYWIHEEPFDYNRYTPYFYRKFAEDNEDVRLIEIKTMGGTGAVLADIIGKKLQGKLPTIAKGIQKSVYKKYKKSSGEIKLWTLGVAAVYEVG